MEIELPDGTVLDAPDDADPSVVAKNYLRSKGAAPAASRLTPAQQQWVAGIRPHAEAAARDLNIDPNAIISQAALETGWGSAAPGNNLFGIKPGSKWAGPSNQVMTTEYANGVPSKQTDAFRAYGSPEQSIADYANLIRNQYPGALAAGTDTGAYFRALQEGGYATDPRYAEKLAGIEALLRGERQPSPQPTGYQAMGGVPAASPNDVAGLSFGDGGMPRDLSSALDQLASNPNGREAINFGTLTQPQAMRAAERYALPEIEVSSAPLTLDEQIAYDNANTTPPGTDGVWEALKATVPGWYHTGRQWVAGTREFFNENQEQREYIEYLRAQTIPEAYKRFAQSKARHAINGDVQFSDDMWNDPKVVEAAKAAGVPVARFLQDWPKYVNMTPEQSFQYQAEHLSESAEDRNELAAAVAARESAIHDAEMNTPNFPSRWSPGSFVFQGGQMVPDLAAAIGGTLAGGPGAGIAAMSGTVFPRLYGQEKHEGKSHEQALGIGGARTLAEAIPEMGFLSHATKAAKGATLAQRLARRAKAGAAEGKSEFFTSLANKGIDAATGKPLGSPGDVLSDVAFETALGVGPGVLLAGSGPSRREQLIEALQNAKRSSDLGKIITPEAASAWNAPQQASQPATKVTPEATEPPATMAAPGRTGSPVPEPAEVKASAPITSAAQGTAQTPAPPAPPPPAPPTATTETAVPPAPPAPEIPEPAPAPHATPVSTAQETQAGGTAAAPALTTDEPDPFAPKPKAPLSPLPKIGKGQKAKPLAPDHQERVTQNVDLLRGMAETAGWAERGGLLIRDKPEDETNLGLKAEVVGRTKWLANAPWFREVIRLPNNENGDASRAAVEKAIAGQKLSPTEAAHVSQMIDWAENETAKAKAEMVADFDAFPAAQAVAETKTETDSVDPTDPLDTALIDKANQLDEGAVERAAMQSEDHTSYMQAIRGIIAAHEQAENRASEPGGETVSPAPRREEGAPDFQLAPEQAAPAAREVKPAAAQGELLPKNQTKQDLADRAREKDEKRSPNKDVPADIGGGLFAKKQTDIEDVEEPPADEDEMVELDDAVPEDPEDGSVPGGTLKSSMPGKTGRQPPQQLPGEDTPVDPIKQVAGERAAAIEERAENDKTPESAPGRDQKLGASPYETLWRDLYRAPYDNETMVEYVKAKDEFVAKMQGSPMRHQIRWAQSRLKQYYDFKDVDLDPRLTEREQMDAMLDAYNNLSIQAKVMGQPKEAMGFNGDLTLRIRKTLGDKHTRGEFSWDFVQGFGASSLSLARRADSFTHEWFHALDLNLLMRFTKRLATGLSGAMHQTRVKLKELPTDIHDSFQEVMRAILLTDAASMQKMANITLEAANTQELLTKARQKLRATEAIADKEAERTKKAEEYEAAADMHRKKNDNFRGGSNERAAKQLREGTAKAKAALPARKAEVERLEKKLKQLNKDAENLLNEKASALVQGSKFADFMQGKEYFSIPAELFARAGESWMANRIGQQAGTEFLTSSPEYYNERDDDLLRLVYPNKADRVRIFAAMDRLFSTLAQHEYFEGDTVAAKMPQPFSIEKELNIEAKKNKRVNAVKLVWQALAADLRAVGKLFKALKNPTKFLPEAKADFARGVGYFKEFLYKFYTSRGRLLSLEASAKEAGNDKLARLIRQVLLKLTNDPGSGDTQTEGMEQEVQRRTQTNLNNLKRIEDMHDLDVDDEKQMAQLYEELTKPTEETRVELEEYQQFLKDKLASLQGDKNKTDQIRRLRAQQTATQEHLDKLDKPSKAPQNIRDAAVAIRKMMNEEFYYNDKAGIKLGYKSNYMHRIYDDEAINQDRAGFVAAATEVYEFEQQKALRDLNRKLGALEDKLRTEKSIARNLKRGPEAANKIKAEMDAVRVEMAEVQARKPEEQARNWAFSSQVGDMFQFDRSTPASSYTKGRVLGPYADIAMRDYQDQNPISILHQYLPMSARRAAYASRFGAEHEKYQALRLRMVQADITQADLETIDQHVKYVTGTYDPGISKGFRSAINSIYNILTMAILPASIFVNLFEPITAGLRTGRVRDGLNNVWETMRQVIGTGDAAAMREIADVIGIMSAAGSDTVIQNRLFLEGEGKTAAVAEHFYKVTGMHGYTNASRIATMKMAGRYLRTWADILADPKAKAEAKAAVAEEFREMGIPDKLHEKFAAFVRGQGNMISLNSLADPNNQQIKQHYIAAMHSFVDSVIGNPKAADRPVMAFNPVGRFVMSISAFNYYFQRHVLARFGRRFQRAEGAGGKAAVAMQFVLPMLSLMVAQMAARMLREFMQDREKFEKRVDDLGKDPVKSFFNAIDAAGGTGGFSPIYNALFKSRYTRDFSSIAMGAAPGFLIDNLQAMYNGIADEKDPNDTSNQAERAAVTAGYRMTVNTMMPRVLYALGARGPLAWLALTQATSYSMANSFGEMTKPKTPNELAAADARQKRESRTPAQERRSERERQNRQRNIERRFGT